MKIDPVAVLVSEQCHHSYQQKNIHQAMLSCTEAAAQGDTFARYLLAVLESDHEILNAVQIERAKGGNPLHQYVLADVYFYGEGMPRNYAEAAKWYKKAARKGRVEAALFLGVIYDLGGYGTKTDPTKAAQWYRKAAEAGNWLAQNRLGRLYHMGLGLLRDDKQAVFWFEKSAKHKYPSALVNLGKMFMDGLGVSKDTTRAISLYKEAALQYDGEAEYLLALAYQHGNGVKQDKQEAFKLMDKAAQKIELDSSSRWFRKEPYIYQLHAEYKLGEYYEKGIGTKKNIAKAKQWYQLAAKRGNKLAQQALLRFQNKSKINKRGQT